MSTVSHAVPTRYPVVPTVPAVALAPTGRLPFTVQAVAAVAARADQLAAGTPADPFDTALDAIEAVFAASTNPERDWRALRVAVNLYAGRDARTGEK